MTIDDDTKQPLEGVKIEILERIERTETNLLTAFQGWSTTMELRLKSLPATEQRLSVLEDRLSEIERKLLKKGI